MESAERIVEDVACTLCACVCDDLKITVRDNRIVGAERACFKAEPWFLSQEAGTPSVAVSGEQTTFDEAIKAAADILKGSLAPLFYGLSHSSTEGQRAAVALADRLGATIDTTASDEHAPSIMAMQQSGESTCTLGEIRNRADLVIYWGANPLESHPRHLERYSTEPTGQYIPQGRQDRCLVVVDHLPTTTSEQANWFIPLEKDCSFEALWTLRGLVRGIEPEPEAGVGAPIEELRKLAQRMKSCRCGVIFFGEAVAKNPLGHRNIEALLRLVTELNQFTRFHARRLRVVGDVSGADSVLCWQTGYPFSVNFARGFPRYNPGEYSAANVLANREADAVVLIGSSYASRFPPAAFEHLQMIPTIILDRFDATLPFTPTVHFVTATYGIHRPGTAYRMDEVPIRLRPVLDSTLPSDGEVLRAIHERIG